MSVLRLPKVTQVWEKQGFSMFVLRCAVAVAFALSAVPVAAQTSLGRLIGQVTDSSAAVINGAEVEIRNTRTNLTRSAQSDNTVAFLFEALEP